jgi:hypothetical protein
MKASNIKAAKRLPKDQSASRPQGGDWFHPESTGLTAMQIFLFLQKFFDYVPSISSTKMWKELSIFFSSPWVYILVAAWTNLSALL